MTYSCKWWTYSMTESKATIFPGNKTTRKKTKVSWNKKKQIQGKWYINLNNTTTQQQPLPSEGDLETSHTAWKESKYGVFWGLYFLVLSINTGKYGAGKTLDLDIFRALTTCNITKTTTNVPRRAIQKTKWKD